MTAFNGTTAPADDDIERIHANEVLESLRSVIDPELGIDIISLGLVYRISVDAGNVDILMTLTVPGCPMHDTITADVKNTVGTLAWAMDVRTELTFDPPWSTERLSPEARQQLGR